jgi:hypothetical protein
MASIPITEPSAPALSEYEQARARNIERNNARLRSLGLIGHIEERRSNDMAWGRQHCGSGENFASDDGDSSSDEEYVDGDNISKTKKKKKRSRSALSPKEGSRKSRRLMNLSTQYDSDDIFGDGRETSTESATERKDRLQMEREKLVAECREARLRVANELAMAGVMDAAAGNPTASYEHCMMRVRSMTEKGLANRVSVSTSNSIFILPNMSLFM